MIVLHLFRPPQVLSLLKWSMLAACTIGPGTVVVCSKSGADYQLQLQWTLVAASFVAFVLQKEVRAGTGEKAGTPWVWGGGSV